MQTQTEMERSTAGAHVRSTVTVNGVTLHLADSTPDARQILSAANFIPADEHILVQVFAHGTRAIGLDETLNLRDPGAEVFWAFKSDRGYRFTVDERGFDWGAATIAEPMLRAIAHVADCEILVLERRDEPDLELGPGDKVELSNSGTEHLRIEKRLVEVFFKDVPYELARGVYTTEQLMTKFPIEPGYLLNLKTSEGELVTLKAGEAVHLKCGMHFYSQVPGGGSS